MCQFWLITVARCLYVGLCLGAGKESKATFSDVETSAMAATKPARATGSAAESSSTSSKQAAAPKKRPLPLWCRISGIVASVAVSAAVFGLSRGWGTLLLSVLCILWGVILTPSGPSPQVAAEKMRAILEAFLAELPGSKELAKFSEGKSIVFQFVLTDMETSFYTSFQSGAVQAGFGSCPGGSADVTLKMKAYVLDGMFTGNINGNTAALTGKLAFQGNVTKGLALQRVQPQLMKLYGAVRAKIGDPGVHGLGGGRY